MGLQLNITDCQKSEILPKYFTFSVQEDLEEFITLHKKLLRWWLGKYIPSYVKDITDNAVAYPLVPAKWRITWQQAIAKCSPEGDLQIEDFDITRLPEEQSARPLVGAEDERITLQQDDTEKTHDGIGQGITRRGTRIDEYCGKHYKQ